MGELGSSGGHGFGSGLWHLIPLGGLQAWCSGRCGRPLGLFQAPKSWGTNPSIPLGPARDGGTARGGREQNEVGEPVRAYALKASPKDLDPQKAGE